MIIKAANSTDDLKPIPSKPKSVDALQLLMEKLLLEVDDQQRADNFIQAGDS